MRIGWLHKLEQMEKKKKTLLNRYNTGHYRSMKKYGEVYNQILRLYQPYITKDTIKMLAHPYATKSNEVMNKSVVGFPSKDKTFSKTESLDTRVNIATGTQVLGYHDFCMLIIDKFGISADENLRHFLKLMQAKKD